MEIEPTPQPENTAQTMRDVMMNLHRTEQFHVGAASYFDIPAGRGIQNITEEVRAAKRQCDAAMPVRIKGTATLQTLKSLIDWTNRFQGDQKDETALFLNKGKTPSLSAVMNYHIEGAAVRGKEGEDARARHADHIGIYDFPISDAWANWNHYAGAEMSVADFGGFLEDSLHDLIDPTPFLVGDADDTDQDWEVEARNIARKLKSRFATAEKMIEMGRTFSVNVDSSATVKVDRASGAAMLNFQQDHKDDSGKPLTLPRLFLIAIPVFEQGDVFPIVCTFGYRVRGGVPTLHYKLYDAAAAMTLAVTEAGERAAKETGAPLFYGNMERE